MATAAVTVPFDFANVNALEDASSDLYVADVYLQATDRFATEARRWLDFIPSDSKSLAAELSCLSTMADEARDKINEAKVKVDQHIANAFDVFNAKRGLKSSEAWDRAVERYETLRKVAEGMSDEHPGIDKAVEAYCDAMDYLIEKVPSPSSDALKYKLDLALERAGGFVGLHSDHEMAIYADIKRLASE